MELVAMDFRLPLCWQLCAVIICFLIMQTGYEPNLTLNQLMSNKSRK